jgi:hypothetical protein
VQPDKCSEIAILSSLSNSITKLGPPCPSTHLHNGDNDDLLQKACFVMILVISHFNSGQREVSGKGFSSNFINATLEEIRGYGHFYKPNGMVDDIGNGP